MFTTRMQSGETLNGSGSGPGSARHVVDGPGSVSGSGSEQNIPAAPTPVPTTATDEQDSPVGPAGPGPGSFSAPLVYNIMARHSHQL